MSYKIIILQHTPLVTPGYFTKLMNEDLVETTIIRLDEGEKIPVNLDIFDGMICLGGPMDTWMEEQYPWMIEEKNKIKEFVLSNQKPYLGICLGCQFLGEILGGKVIKSNPPEIGVLNIDILDTPGHTMSHLCLLIRGSEDALFCGDTLFNAGVGNCHNGGNPLSLYNTFYNQLIKLDKKTKIYPGHDYGEKSSILLKENIKMSPLLQAKNLIDFKEKMKNYEDNRKSGS